MSSVPPNAPAPKSWTWKHTYGVLGLSLLLLLVSLFQLPGPAPRLKPFPPFVGSMARYPTVCAWLMDLILMVGIAAVIAQGLTGSARGIFIDEQKRISLARFQVVIWTFLILSAVFAAGVGNALAGQPDPLGINIPSTVWAQLGISAVSMVGTSMILSGKKVAAPPVVSASPLMPSSVGGVDAPARSWKDRLRAQGVETASLSVQGTAVVRDDIASTTWGDMFRGDDMASFESIDLSKLQLFFLTTLLTFTYAVALASKFIEVDRARATAGTGIASPGVPGVVGIAPQPSTPRPDPKRVDQFPPLDSSILALLGIGNAGLLASKAVSRPNPPT